MRFMKLFALLLALVVITPSAASPVTPADLAALPSWALNMQGQSRTYAADRQNPQILYSWRGLHEGFDKSSDDGQTWQHITINAEHFTVISIKVDPEDSHHLLGVLRGDSSANLALYGSYDGGMTWDRLLDAEIHDVAFNTRMPTEVFASAQGGAGAGLWRSNDTGHIWTQVNVNPALRFDTLFPNPFNRSVLYARMHTGTEWVLGVSYDRGQHWDSVGPYVGIRFTSDPEIMYAWNNRQVVRTLDGGTTWTIIKEPFFEDVWPSVNPINPQELLVMDFSTDKLSSYIISRSTDAGTTWTVVNSTPGEVLEWVWRSPANPDRVYAADSSRSYTSADGGQTWTQIGCPLMRSGFSHSTIETQAFFLSIPGALHKTINDGTTCVAVDTPGNPAHGFDYATDPNNPNRMARLLARNGVELSSDGGATWTSHNAGLDLNLLYDQLAFSPVDGELLLTRRDGQGGTNPTPTYIAHTDGTSAWEWVQFTTPPLANTVISDLAFGPASADALYTIASRGGASTNTLYRSDAAGAVWQTLPFSSTAPPALIAADPHVAGKLYVATLNKVYRSVDNGQTWHINGTGIPYGAIITALEADPNTPNTVYASTLNYGLLRSSDSGFTWEYAGLIVINEHVVSIAFTPAATTLRSTGALPTVYVVTSQHIYAGMDNGDFWRTLVTPIDWAISELAVPQQAGQLLVGTHAGPQAYTSVAPHEIFMPHISR